MVEDRLVPREALEAHHLFGQQRPVVAELDVPLARNLAESLVEGHGGRIVRRASSREVGEPLADRRRELEAVARAGRADDDAAAPLEDEALVGRGRVHARLGSRRLGLGQPVGVVRPGGDALDQLRVRLARHVRVGLLPGVVRADLQPVDRVVERVHVVRVAVGLERDDRRNRPAAGVRAEVAERLACGLDRQRLVEQLVDPGAGRHDDHVCVELVRADPLALAHVQLAAERGERLVGAGDPGLVLSDHERTFRHLDRKAPLGLLRVEPLPGDTAALERVGGALLERAHDLDQAV